MRPPPDLSLSQTAFAYAVRPHTRRHGPQGYRDDDNYKPWLRDEYFFRCLYCCCREVWFPDGDRAFSVEHLQPRSTASPGLTPYDTLAYACCQCNALRQAALLPVNPEIGLGLHLEIIPTGAIRALSAEGMESIQICRLDRPNLTAFRRLILDTLRYLQGKKAELATELLRRYLGYPEALPNLGVLTPPGGNTRPLGVASSAFALRIRRELPAIF